MARGVSKQSFSCSTIQSRARSTPRRVTRSVPDETHAPFAPSLTSSTLNLRVQSRRVTRSVILPIPVSGNQVFEVAQPIQCRKLAMQGSHSAVAGGWEGEGRRWREGVETAMCPDEQWLVEKNQNSSTMPETHLCNQPCSPTHDRPPQVWKAPSSSCLCFGHHRSCAALRSRAYTFFCLCKHWEHGAPTSREHDRPVVYQHTLVDLTARLLVPATCSPETSTSEAL